MKRATKCFYGLLIIGVALLSGCGAKTPTTTADTTAPSSPSVSINSSASSTSSNAVTLALSATDDVGVTGYYASETSTTPSASATGWTSVTSATSYSASVSFTLSSGDGTKTVYGWFKDAVGNVSAAAIDTITLSTGSSGVSTKFPIATTTDTTSTDGTNKNPGREMSVSAAFDGTNYLVGIQGDATAHYDVTAQLISSTGSLVGSRISTGRTGGAPQIAFNGTNYLMAWEDDATYPNNVIYGQIISTSGSAVTSPFAISTTTGTMRLGGIVCDTSTGNCYVAWSDASTGKAYGRQISSTGAFLTDEQWFADSTATTPITSVKSGVGGALGSNTYLFAWDSGADIRASIGDRTSGANIKLDFVIATKNQGTCTDNNRVGVAFDGTNYLVVWNDHSDCVQPIANWDILAQRVDDSGNLVGSAFQVNSANTARAAIPSLAFDGTNYLITWIDGRNDANKDGVCDSSEGTCWDAYGQYVSTSGALVGSEFVINNDAGNQWGFVTGFNNGKYLVLVDTGVTVNSTTELFGDVYGVFVTP